VDIDLISPDQWTRGVPHEQFEWLRREAPVYWHESDDPAVPGFWALTRHADVQAANRDIDRFSSQRGGVFLGIQTDEQRDLFRSIIETDRPEHTRLRRLVNRGFTPRAIAQFEASYRQAVRDVLHDVVARGTFDWVTEVATVLPAYAISELLGVPVEDRPQVTAWTNIISGANDPEFADDADAPMNAAIALYTYGTQLAEQRRVEPRDDIVTSLITEVDDDALGAHEFEVFVLALAVAGNETTRTAMSQGMLALLDNPDQMAALRSEPELAPLAADEMIRWATPIVYFRRTATCDRGRPRGALLPVRQLRRRGLLGSPPFRHRPDAQSARVLRRRRAALLPGRASGTIRDLGAARGAPIVHELDRTGRGRRPASIELDQRTQAPTGDGLVLGRPQATSVRWGRTQPGRGKWQV